jgi:hypothetical protein
LLVDLGIRYVRMKAGSSTAASLLLQRLVLNLRIAGPLRQEVDDAAGDPVCKA